MEKEICTLWKTNSLLQMKFELLSFYLVTSTP